MSTAPSTRTPSALWRIKDVAEFLNVDVRTVRRWRQTEATFPLPVDLPGRTLRWFPSNLLSWIRGTHGR
jgi:predicted DNA-binding transcriptional regulator AlpA